MPFVMEAEVEVTDGRPKRMKIGHAILPEENVFGKLWKNTYINNPCLQHLAEKNPRHFELRGFQ